MWRKQSALPDPAGWIMCLWSTAWTAAKGSLWYVLTPPHSSFVTILQDVTLKYFKISDSSRSSWNFLHKYYISSFCGYRKQQLSHCSGAIDAEARAVQNCNCQPRLTACFFLSFFFVGTHKLLLTEDAKNQGIHVIGYLQDYNTLKKQILDAKTWIRQMASLLQSDVKLQDNMVTGKVWLLRTELSFTEF